MTEAIELPDDIGRNDPCPCGSGKKYKKCHMRIHRAQEEASRQTQSAEDIIPAHATPYELFQILGQVYEERLVPLYHDLLHEHGPLKARLGDQQALLVAVDEGRERLPAGPDYEFLRMRVDEPDVHLLLASGVEDPRAPTISYELLTLRRHEADADGQPRSVEHTGWRVWQLERQERNKHEVDEANPHLDTFGVGWHPRELRDPPTRQRPAPGASSEEE